MHHEMFDIAVVGGGGAGTMAYLRSVLNNDNTALFLGDALAKKRGRALWVADVENIPGMHFLKKPITSTTESTLKWIEEHHKLNNGKVFKFSVKKIENHETHFRLFYDEKGVEQVIHAKYVIIATGVMDVQPEINGSIKPIFPFANRGDVLYCVRCDGHKTIGHKLSIIGNNDSAIGIAAMMKERYGHQHISILTNGLEFTFTEKFLELAKQYDFEFIYSPITGILGTTKEGLKGYSFEHGEVETTMTIISLGIIVYNDLLKQVKAELDPAGKAIVNNIFESSINNLFVVGDLVSGKKMQIYTGWDEAVDASDEINRRIRLEKRALATKIS